MQERRARKEDAKNAIFFVSLPKRSSLKISGDDKTLCDLAQFLTGAHKFKTRNSE
jgi:hypothetical protein